MMSRIPLFAKYAEAFEKAYAANDWPGLEPHFTENAVYEVKDLGPPFGDVAKGRTAILSYFDRVLNGFDRRFASRTVSVLEGPREDADSVWVRGAARYTAPGVPDLEFALEETAWFEGDRIRRLEDCYDAATVARVEAYVREHGAKLGIAPS
jgi:hypothetical protein